MRFLLLAVISLVLSGLATGRVLRYALAKDLIDHPNERSSHTRPTPRGGGLALASTILVGIIAATALGWLETDLGFAIGGGGLLVALVGWIDDHRPLSPALRVLVHLSAAAWALYWLGGLPSIRLSARALELGWIGPFLGLLGIGWAVNLYNFMDGIDGLAGGQAALTAGLGGAFLLADGQSGPALVAALTLGASLGFLVWNWPPAKVFMGDVGSGLLGFVFATLAVASENAGSLPVVGWMLLLGVFVFDASITLLRRIMAGDRWYEAHRSHAYQRAVQSGWTHRRVTCAMLLVAVLLGGLAWLGWRWPNALLPMVLLAVLLLAAGYVGVERRRPMAP